MKVEILLRGSDGVAVFRVEAEENAAFCTADCPMCPHDEPHKILEWCIPEAESGQLIGAFCASGHEFIRLDEPMVD